MERGFCITPMERYNTKDNGKQMNQMVGDRCILNKGQDKQMYGVNTKDRF